MIEQYREHLWSIRSNGKFANFHSDTGERIPEQDKQAAQTFICENGYTFEFGGKYYLTKKGIAALSEGFEQTE